MILAECDKRWGDPVLIQVTHRGLSHHNSNTRVLAFWLKRIRHYTSHLDRLGVGLTSLVEAVQFWLNHGPNTADVKV